MTPLQKQIIQELLQGGNIANCFASGYRLRDGTHNGIRRFTAPTFFSLQKFLRKEKSGLYVINKNKIRQERGNAWIKKQYKLLNK